MNTQTKLVIACDKENSKTFSFEPVAFLNFCQLAKMHCQGFAYETADHFCQISFPNENGAAVIPFSLSRSNNAYLLEESVEITNDKLIRMMQLHLLPYAKGKAITYLYQTRRADPVAKNNSLSPVQFKKLFSINRAELEIASIKADVDCLLDQLLACESGLRENILESLDEKRKLLFLLEA